MELIILGSIFGAVWLVTTITFVVLYKKKSISPAQTDDSQIRQIVTNQKEQQQMLNNMLMQALKNSEISTQNTINNLSVLQKQEFNTISKRVDELTLRNEQRIEKLTFDVRLSLNSMRQENEKALEKMRETVDEKLNSSLSQRNPTY